MGPSPQRTVVWFSLLGIVWLSLVSCQTTSRVVWVPAAPTCAASTPSPAADDEEPPAIEPVDVTFLAQSDTHFGAAVEDRWIGRPLGAPGTVVTTDEVHRHVADEANQIEGRPWPGALGGTVGRPAGMIIAGDLTEQGEAPEWSAFERVYATRAARALSMPLAESIGNHDKGDFVAEQVARRHGSVVYSADWGPLHVVSLGEEPTDESVPWLRRDLACVSPGSPVVVFFHKPVTGPYSAGGWLSSNAHARQFLDALAGHDIAAIIHGHVHQTGPYEWNGIPVFVTGSAKAQARSFLVIHLTDDRLQVAAWNYETEAFWWWEQRPRHGAPVAWVREKRAVAGREPLVPYPTDPAAAW